MHKRKRKRRSYYLIVVAKMRWFDKRYHTLDHEMKTTFGRKVAKLSSTAASPVPTEMGLLDREAASSAAR